MRSKLPTSDSNKDSEEPDAVHRRFLPKSATATTVTMANPNYTGLAGSGSFSSSSEEILKSQGGQSQSEDDLKNKLINSGGAAAEGEADNENNFLPLKSETPDYGATGTGERGKGEGNSKKEDVRFAANGNGGCGSGGGGSGGNASPTSENPSKMMEESSKEKVGFDWLFFKRFWRINGVLFMNVCSAATGLFVFLLCFVLLKEYVGYQVGLIASGFYKTLGERDLSGFWKQTFTSLALILAIAFIKCSTLYTQKVLTVTFRKILCEVSHRLYFADIRFYQLNVLDKTVDNPDQRMTQDIERFTTTYCDVLPKLLVSPFTIGYYCYQGYLRSGWEGPVGCFGFFLVATAVNKCFMNPIVHYVARQEKCEGDFRFLHTLIRVNSESMAFHKAAMLEHDKVEVTLQNLLDTQRKLYWNQYLLSFCIDLFDYIGSIVSYLMLAIPIFNGRYDDLSSADLSFLISQNAFILIYLISTFTSLVDLSGKFADIAGFTHRISQLLERLNALEEFWADVVPDENGRTREDCSLFDEWQRRRREIRENMHSKERSFFQNDKNPSISTPEDASSILPNNGKDTNDGPLPLSLSFKGRKLPIWTLENVTFSTPGTNQPLISNLSMEFVVGESVIITGPSSAGKSSILRVLRGLWPFSDGNLKRHYPPGTQGVYFCPQNSYLTWGTLREQISFPLRPDTSHLDNRLIQFYVERLRLSPVVERVGGLDHSCSWSVYDSLSPGEKQRLCLLRVFYHQPVVAVLDEATSNLPTEMQEFVYSELKRLGITLISVGHQEAIRKYHDKQLIISPKNGLGLYPIIHEED